MAFVALAVHRYILHLKDANQAFPNIDDTEPTLGIMDPVAPYRVALALSSST